jgi:F0F1-type ATP synthase membrane subunit a
MLEFFRIEVFRPALKEHTDRFAPFLWSMFFFILFCNMLGWIPFGEIIALITQGRAEHWGGTATGTMSTTGGLAIATFFVIHFSGVLESYRSLRRGVPMGHHAGHGDHSKAPFASAQELEHMRGDALAAELPSDFRAVMDPTHHYTDDMAHSHGEAAVGAATYGDLPAGMQPMSAALAAVPVYLWNFAPHPFKPEEGGSPLMYVADVPMWLFLLFLEFIGALVKPFALAIRLFANMIAGHTVLAVLAGLIVMAPTVAGQIGVGIPMTLLSLLIRALELFVVFLHAYIFVFLATLFIASAVAPEH